ncbi:hydantoinase/oxoprolinase family protein [Nocardia sp. NPDC019395]|uniref:hydantoinase/oxoprolinase family protein n=1 Tax=Nocardia sp. NPDC019395 TaxID=3154686 RepID=UPI0033C106EF
MAAAQGPVGYVIGVDIGGTFTDCSVVTPEGRVYAGKSPTTPDDRSRGFFDAIEDAGHGIGLGLDELLAQCSRLVHGTTTGTNALITRDGAKTALVTSAGHGDMIYLMKGSGRLAGVSPEQVFDLPGTDKPEPLVPRSLVAEVSERVDFEGDEIVPLDTEALREHIRRLVGEGVDSFAVSFLWSMRDPAHERAAVEMISKEAPDAFVTCASDLTVRIGEYERTNTSIINAYIGPLMRRYIGNIDAGAARRGYEGRVLYAQCAGGAITTEEAQRAPIKTVHSGPVSGTLGSSYLASRLGEPNVIVTDMGGTSFDVSIVRKASPDLRDVSLLERFDVALPMVYLDSVGAGGGSIAWIDPAGGLQVGPRSAGAVPGPACYGKGGTQPTVTDADVVLGIVDPDNFLHGSMRLDVDAARAAVRQVAEPLGLSIDEAAAGISRIVDSRMADLLRRVSILRGLDPRDYVCFAYGGGGPVHAGAYAREVGFKSLIVPLAEMAPVWSAFGAATADVVHVVQRWETVDLPASPDRSGAVFEELEREVRATLADEGFTGERVTIQRSLHMKYRAQVYQVEVPLAAGPFAAGTLATAENDFERIYDELHGEGSGYREGGVQIAGFSIHARGLVEPVEIRPDTDIAEVVSTSRSVYWYELGQRVETPVLRMKSGRLAEELEGPLLLQFPDTVVTIRPGQRARFDSLGNLVLDV